MKGYKNTRHQAVKAAIIKITRSNFRQLQNEPVLKDYFSIRTHDNQGNPIVVNNDHRADILFIPPDAPLAPILGDVTIRHATTDVIRSQGPKVHERIHHLLQYKGLGAKAGHEDKMKFYGNRYNNIKGRIIPIALDTYGFLHDESYKFLNRFIGKGTKFQNLLNVLSFTIQQYASSMINIYLTQHNAAAVKASKPMRRLDTISFSYFS